MFFLFPREMFYFDILIDADIDTLFHESWISPDGPLKASVQILARFHLAVNQTCVGNETRALSTG